MLWNGSKDSFVLTYSFCLQRLDQVARNSELSEYLVGLLTSHFSDNIISKENSFFMIKLFKLKKLNSSSARWMLCSNLMIPNQQSKSENYQINKTKLLFMYPRFLIVSFIFCSNRATVIYFIKKR